MKATKIKMKTEHRYSKSIRTINQIYLEGSHISDFYTKDFIHDYLKLCPGTIHAGIYPYQPLISIINPHGEKCVRSKPDKMIGDNLLDLPQIYS